MWRAPSPNRRAVVERLDGGQDAVEVEQRLAHPHEHDVGQPAAVRDEAAGGVADLVDDLGHLEIAPETELAGGAEGAADGAPGLARDAQRVPFARSRPGRVVHEHGLDQGAVAEAVKGLLGQAAVGTAELGVGDGIEPVGGSQLGAQRGRQGPHFVERSRAPAPYANGDLAGAIRGHLALGQPGREHIRRQAGDAGPGISGHGWMLAQRCRRSPRARAGTRPTAFDDRRPAAPRGG